MIYGIPATRVVAYIYEAGYHCGEDAIGRFSLDEDGYLPEDATDDEGNPVHPVFASDLDLRTVETCDDCGAVICLACGEKDANRAVASPCWNCAMEWRTEDD